MSITALIRKIVKEREAIPAFDALLFNATVARVLRKPEAMIAGAVVRRVRGGTVVDIGSGPGYLLTDIARIAPDLHLYGIDLSMQMVKLARRHNRNAANVQLIFSNAIHLPFKDSSVDLIISTGTLHHWRTPATVFNECYRVLRTGGEAWIYDGCPDVFKDRARRARLKRDYGWLIPAVGLRVAELNGFAMQEYETRIRGLLDGTGFRGNYRMDLTDIWMKLTLKKQGAGGREHRPTG
jgi:ubiquinone/menaquinone biosynthesis C-methylase UbiE